MHWQLNLLQSNQYDIVLHICTTRPFWSAQMLSSFASRLIYEGATFRRLFPFQLLFISTPWFFRKIISSYTLSQQHPLTVPLSMNCVPISDRYIHHAFNPLTGIWLPLPVTRLNASPFSSKSWIQLMLSKLISSSIHYRQLFHSSPFTNILYNRRTHLHFTSNASYTLTSLNEPISLELANTAMFANLHTIQRPSLIEPSSKLRCSTTTEQELSNSVKIWILILTNVCLRDTSRPRIELDNGPLQQ